MSKEKTKEIKMYLERYGIGSLTRLSELVNNEVQYQTLKNWYFNRPNAFRLLVKGARKEIEEKFKKDFLED